MSSSSSASASASSPSSSDSPCAGPAATAATAATSARSESVDHPLLDTSSSSAATGAADAGAPSPPVLPRSPVFFDAGPSFGSPDRPYDGGDDQAPRGESSASGGAHAELAPPVSHPAAGRSRLDAVRVALGRFGRFVGMRVPGAVYTSVSQEDEDGAALPSGSQGPRRGRVVGSGLGQDGVFSNMSAKPERRRRRRPHAGMEGDRGSDDDLADEEEVPPSYAAAAADAVPPYWETTMMGGLSHPLAPGGSGWTPGSPTVGAIEDLIIEGLPVGNLFGFLWNLLVSVSFQFVGFLLTYLLHTTHAAKAGSRVGLGITLVQYGVSLHASASKARSEAAAQAQGSGKGAEDPGKPAGDISSADWLSICLVALGGLIMIASTVSYIKLWRLGHQLVKEARRQEADSEAAPAAEAGTGSADGEADAQTRHVERAVTEGIMRLMRSGRFRTSLGSVHVYADSAHRRPDEHDEHLASARIFELDDLDEPHER